MSEKTNLKIPKSTISYRIKRLEDEGIIEGYHAKVNAVFSEFENRFSIFKCPTL